MIQLKMDMIESFLSTIEVNCLKLASSHRPISQKIWNVTRWSVFQEIRDCPTYKKNIRNINQKNVQLKTFVGLWPCQRYSSLLYLIQYLCCLLIFRQDDTVEKAADYNFCKVILKEIFHIKMKNIVNKSPDYVR